jgi:hypothetical protein
MYLTPWVGRGETKPSTLQSAPFGEAIAAEPGEIHHIDVLYIGARLEVLDELAKSVCLCGQLFITQHFSMMQDICKGCCAPAVLR